MRSAWTGVSFLARALVLAGLALGSIHAWAQDPEPEPPVAGDAGGTKTIHLAKLEGAVDSVMADHVAGVVEKAEAADAAAVVFELDTPGGTLGDTKAIVSTILSSRVPVIVYVSPRGAWAGSAGTFITMSAHVAAMAPGTTIGAAHPVGPGGTNPGQPMPLPLPFGQPPQPSPPQERNFAGEKIENFSVAWAESVAQATGRNAEWAAQAVKDSVAITAIEAQEIGVVDLISPDLEALLASIEGREVRVDGETVPLALAGATIERFEIEESDRLIALVTSPQVIMLLVMAGLFGLYTEFTNPGAIIPGVAGALALLLAILAMQVLPFDWIGLALVLLGFVLMGVELFVPTFGIVFMIGAISLLVGAYMIFDVPELPDYAPSFWPTVFPIVAAVVAGMGAIVFIAGKSLFRPVFAGSGVEGLVGLEGVVDSMDAGTGRVKLQGELWRACASGPLEAGDRVRVDRVEDLVLHVSKTRAAGSEENA